MTSDGEEVLERGSKLIAGGVGIIGTATSDFLPPDLCAGAAGRGAAELVDMCEQELKEKISKVLSENKKIDAWMKKYIESNSTLRGGAAFEPTKNRHFLTKNIDGFRIIYVFDFSTQSQTQGPKKHSNNSTKSKFGSRLKNFFSRSNTVAENNIKLFG